MYFTYNMDSKVEYLSNYKTFHVTKFNNHIIKLITTWSYKVPIPKQILNLLLSLSEKSNHLILFLALFVFEIENS